MTKAEFIARQRMMQRETNFTGIIGVAVPFGVLASNAWVSARMDHSQPGMPMKLLFGCWALGCIFIGLLLYGVWFRKYRLSKFSLSCPRCGKSLALNVASQIAVATGHCSHCGEAVFDSTRH